MMKIKRKY